MKASVQRAARGSYTHGVRIRDHELTLDEPAASGGDDRGPTPQELLAASLAGCIAITMEMYAQRKGWELDELSVSVEYEPAERGSPTRFNVTLALPSSCTDEQRERLEVIATRCPVHRILEGEVVFDQRVTIAGSGAA